MTMGKCGRQGFEKFFVVYQGRVSFLKFNIIEGLKFNLFFTFLAYLTVRIN